MQAFARIRAAAPILVLCLPLAGFAQTRPAYSSPSSGRTRTDAQSPGTLVITGNSEQAPITRISGHPYIDIESLARITHATVRYVGNQIILTLPSAASQSTSN